jgi:hypothetical protein
MMLRLAQAGAQHSQSPVGADKGGGDEATLDPAIRRCSFLLTFLKVNELVTAQNRTRAASPFQIWPRRVEKYTGTQADARLRRTFKGPRALALKPGPTTNAELWL